MQIDHIVLGIHDLEAGVAQFEALTGLPVRYGGKHAHGRTHNALVSLTDQVYVEILAPAPGYSPVPEYFQAMDTLKAIGFALAVADMQALEQDLAQNGFQSEGAADWARKKPSGEQLKWQLLKVDAPRLNINPFFICWSSETSHPSEQAPTQASLTQLVLTSPYQPQLVPLLAGNVPTIELKKGEGLALTCTLNTPKGEITFSGDDLSESHIFL